MSDTEAPENGLKSDVYSAIGEKLYLNSKYADINFVFESSNGHIEKVPAHRCHLAAGSEVFAAMFSESWSNTNSLPEKVEQHGEVKIVNASATEFDEFLQFFYTNRIHLTVKNVAKVIDLAKQYQVAGCLDVCENFLRTKLSDENVCWAYGLAILFDLYRLKRTCETWIGLHAENVLKTASFLECKPATLAEILKIDAMSCSEVQLFEACMNWVKARNGEEHLTKEVIDARLGSLIYGIRFGTMTFNEFGDIVKKYGTFLDGDEYTEIIRIMRDPDFQPEIMNGNREQRSEKGIELVEVLCSRSISSFPSSEPYFIQNFELTTFTTDYPILLAGIQFEPILTSTGYGYSNFIGMNSEIRIVEIETSGNEKVLHCTREHLKSPLALWIQPILMRPGLKYEIRMYQHLLHYHNICTSGLFKTKVKMDSGVTIQFHNDPVFETDPNVARGVVNQLHFYDI